MSGFTFIMLVSTCIEQAGTFQPSGKERHATRRSISGVWWNEEWEAIKVCFAERGPEKKALRVWACGRALRHACTLAWQAFA